MTHTVTTLIITTLIIKRDCSVYGAVSFMGATSKDAMKLRMTGFECLPPFVIRLG